MAAQSVDYTQLFRALGDAASGNPEPARALFWVSPARQLEALFKTLHNMTDVEAVVKASAAHEVDFLPPPG